jgi:hypothetical protein
LFPSIAPCFFLSTSILDLIVVRSMSDVINDLCTYCPFKNQLISTLIFITLIFYCQSHMKFFKAIQKSVLETCRNQFFFLLLFFIGLSKHVNDCTCITLILFQQHLLNTYVSNISNEYRARDEFKIGCLDDVCIFLITSYSTTETYIYTIYAKEKVLICLIIINAKKTVNVHSHFPFFFFFLSFFLSLCIVKLTLPLNVSR